MASSTCSNAQYMFELDLFTEADNHDPNLPSSNNNIRARTRRVITHLASGDEIRSLSFDSLKDVIDAVAEMNPQVLIALENRNDIWKSKHLLALVQDYFGGSVKMLDFCNSLENCLNRAKNSQTINQLVAVRRFEEEEEEDRLTHVLQELLRFKEADNPITDDFVELLQPVHVSMLKKLQAQRPHLDNKMRKVKGRRRLSSILFAIAFILVSIFLVVAAAITAPPVVIEFAGSLVVLIVPIGKWFDTLWSRCENTLKDQKEVLKLMEVRTRVEVKEIENIRELKGKLKIETKAMLEKTEFALQQDDAVKKTMLSEIKQNMQVFIGTIEELRACADMCSGNIKQARTVILHKILQRADDSTAPPVLDALV